MANLKALRTRIDSVHSTQKLTSAMKMVAAAKLRRAQNTVVASRPYAKAIGALTAKSTAIGIGEQAVGNTELIIATASDRGLAGAFNVNVARAVKKIMKPDTKVFLIGKKLPPLLGRERKQNIIATMSAPDAKDCFPTALEAAKQIIELQQKGEIATAKLVYAFFRSPLVQEIRTQSIIPLVTEETPETSQDETQQDEPQRDEPQNEQQSAPECEQDEREFLQELLPYNLAVQLNKALLENSASEHGARTTAMDNATRNAGEMLDTLTLNYNRARQAAITGELIEIISGAEAL